VAMSELERRCEMSPKESQGGVQEPCSSSRSQAGGVGHRPPASGHSEVPLPPSIACGKLPISKPQFFAL
jgi:hypothetical protein